MSIYESIIAGLNEAIEDARSERGVLERHTVESDTECIVLPLALPPHNTNVVWFDAKSSFSPVFVEVKLKHKEIAGGGVLACAA